MSGREWKPGDVAMIRVPLSSQPGHDVLARELGDLPAVYTASGGWSALSNTDYFWDKGYGFHATEPRPLVVIDPEDREQVAALWRSFAEYRLAHEGDEDGWDGIAAMQYALDQFADPKPRIEEPTGLGAVVELVGGGVLVRTPAPIDDLAVWADMSGDFYPWSALDVAKVLHKGWSQ